jgi:predicted metal-binding membrane protein
VAVNSRFAAMTSTRTSGTVAAALALAAACWAVVIHAMSGMDMGIATELGSFGFFIGLWVAMMAAMMLPGAVPAIARRAREERHALGAPLFAGAYLAVWTVVGLAAYVLYQPHGTSVAGALVVAAGVYELTPIKRACRRRCRENVRSGTAFGLFCFGSSVGLMCLLLALGPMSVVWMAVVALLILAQKLLRPKPVLDVPLAFAIIALGLTIILAPSEVPGLTPAM